MPAISSAILRAVKVLPVPHAMDEFAAGVIFKAVDNVVKRLLADVLLG